MAPGDVVTCSCCGAQALAVFTGDPARWTVGASCALLWDHGTHPRWEATHVAPELCLWCKERQAVLPGSAPLFRPAGLRSVAELDVAFWAAWTGGPNPHAAPAPCAGGGPSNVECPPPSRAADDLGGNKAPLDRPPRAAVPVASPARTRAVADRRGQLGLFGSAL